MASWLKELHTKTDVQSLNPWNDLVEGEWLIHIVLWPLTLSMTRAQEKQVSVKMFFLHLSCYVRQVPNQHKSTRTLLKFSCFCVSEENGVSVLFIILVLLGFSFADTLSFYWYKLATYKRCTVSALMTLVSFKSPTYYFGMYLKTRVRLEEREYLWQGCNAATTLIFTDFYHIIVSIEVCQRWIA